MLNNFSELGCPVVVGFLVGHVRAFPPSML